MTRRTTKNRSLATLVLALLATAPHGLAHADNGAFMPVALPYAGAMPQTGLPPGLIPQGMYMPVYPGMYPMLPSPYMAYPGLLPPYMGGLPMGLPSLPPTSPLPGNLSLPSNLPLSGSLPLPPSALLPGNAAAPQAAVPGGLEGIAPFTGFQLPSIGNMTELPPLVPSEVQPLDPPTASTQAMPPAVPAPAAPAPVMATISAEPATLAPAAPAGPSLPVAPAARSAPPPDTPAAPVPMAPAPSLPFPFSFAPYTAQAAEPATPPPPYTVRRVIGQQEKSQLLQMAMPLMTGLMRMSLSDAVNHFAVKYKAKPGLTYDMVVGAMKRRATGLGMQLVGEQRLTAAGKDGVAAGPRIEVYSFWDAALGTALIQASPEFVVFLPGRVAVLEDANRDVWVMSMDWNPEWVLGYKDKLAISDSLWRGAVDLRERLDAILRAAAEGAP